MEWVDGFSALGMSVMRAGGGLHREELRLLEISIWFPKALLHR